MLERALITSPKGRLRIEPSGTISASPKAVTALRESEDEIMTTAQLRTLEAENIRRALEATGGKVYGNSGAAALLGMKPTTLSSRIKSLGITT
ncbi:hypothetical protein CA13_18160 [Planctomycetes bacterium CA13]|uniref:DNA binding HTH domain-containing protein n=1 Tax=Novipirellula herctigrandis TaxID=2527986 RepID=A0A5C5YZM7_9BACT|nr:hypothetical protein CA13_18160 [Planctomycetes bacterium CA13]